jgi:osmotically-inducible protein OsmY
MKSDSQLRADILEELAWEPGINESEIVVGVKDRVVTLTGYVASYAQKYTAERAVERVGGVRAVAADLQVKLASPYQRTDTDIAHAAVSALDWDIEVPEGVKAKVEKGWITLEGSVHWQFQRAAAERAVRYLNGVKGITNLIAVTPKHASPVEVSQKIKDALRRNAEFDASRITVETADGNVTLKGKVRSWAERNDAETAAWAAPGVTHVDDRIEVSP